MLENAEVEIFDNKKFITTNVNFQCHKYNVSEFRNLVYHIGITINIFINNLHTKYTQNDDEIDSPKGNLEGR